LKLYLSILGHTESGPSFRAKTRRLAKDLHSAFPPSPHPNSHPLFSGGFELHYPTGLLRLTPADVTRGCGPTPRSTMSGEFGSRSIGKDYQDLEAWAWGIGDFRKPEKIYGTAESLTYMLDYMHRHGPFVGIIGFSTGATLGAMLASLLEEHKYIEDIIYPNNVSPSNLFQIVMAMNSRIVTVHAPTSLLRHLL
jgi:hypothetical protein